MASLGLGRATSTRRVGWAYTYSLLIPFLLILLKNGTRRTGIGSVATAALEVGIVSAGAGAEIGVTGTNAVPPGTGDVEANL